MHIGTLAIAFRIANYKVIEPITEDWLELIKGDAKKKGDDTVKHFIVQSLQNTKIT